MYFKGPIQRLLNYILYQASLNQIFFFQIFKTYCGFITNRSFHCSIVFGTFLLIRFLSGDVKSEQKGNQKIQQQCTITKILATDCHHIVVISCGISAPHDAPTSLHIITYKNAYFHYIVLQN